MTDDVDMDAPQISTLREEETPEPLPKGDPTRTSKFRVKLLLGEGSRAGSAAVTAEKAIANPHSEDEDDEDDEEDQLIDDDDDETKVTMVAPVISAPLVTEKKVTVSKRGGSTAGRGRGRGRGSRGGKLGRAGVFCS
jgi:hypothetical protein